MIGLQKGYCILDAYNLPFRIPELAEDHIHDIFDCYLLYEETIGVKLYMLYDQSTSKYKWCVITERPFKNEIPLFHI